MKLLKKLIPLASVASVAAVVAPLATSCGQGWYDASKKLDTTDWAQIAHPTTWTTEEAAEKDYLEAVLADKTILEHDFMYNANGMYNDFKEMEEQSEGVIDLNIKSFKWLIQDVSVRKITKEVEWTDQTEWYLLSMKTGVNINVVADIDGKIPFIEEYIEELQGRLTLKANLTIKLTDFPISATVEYVDGEGETRGDNAVGLYVGEEWWKEPGIAPWAYSYSGSASAKYRNPHDQSLNLNINLKGKKAFDHTNWEDTQWDTDPLGSLTLSFLSNVQSYYLKDVLVQHE